MKEIIDEKIMKNEKLKSIRKFIKQSNVLKKNKILTIIGIIIFVIVTLIFSMSNVDSTGGQDVVEKASLLSDLKTRIIILALIIVSGWIPYFYIPAIAFVLYVITISGDVALSMQTNGKIMMFLVNILPALFDIATASIISSIALYMSGISTKKHRFSQRRAYSLLDLKMRFYEMANKKDKYEELLSKKQERMDKINKNDVKIDYMNILKIVPIVIIVNMIICVIQYFIN